MSELKLIPSLAVAAGVFGIYNGLKHRQSAQGKIQIALGTIAVIGGIYALMNSSTPLHFNDYHATKTSCQNFLMEHLKPTLAPHHIESILPERGRDCYVTLTEKGMIHLGRNGWIDPSRYSFDTCNSFLKECESACNGYYPNSCKTTVNIQFNPYPNEIFKKLGNHRYSEMGAFTTFKTKEQFIAALFSER